jgi:hypothetical protein
VPTARLPLLEGDFLIVDYEHRHLARYAWRLDKRGLAYRLAWVLACTLSNSGILPL